MVAFVKREKSKKTIADADTREDMIIDVISDIIVRDLERDVETVPTSIDQSRCRTRFKELSKVYQKFIELKDTQKTLDCLYHPHPRYEGKDDGTEEDTRGSYKGHKHTYGYAKKIRNNM